MVHILVKTITLLCLVSLVDSKTKSVSINLKAKWSSTPFLAETSEYFFNKSSELFWSFVEATTSLTLDAENYNEHEDYTKALEVASRLLTPSKLRLLKFALSTRYYSPMVHMHQEIAKDRSPPENCKLFVEINGFVTCELAAFKAFLKTLKSSDTLVLSNERTYPSKQESPLNVVLYGRLGTEEFNSWHKTLVELSNRGEVTYIFRHYFKNKVKTKCFLSGYGVELAIKSTEYKAKDDTKVEDGQSKNDDVGLDEVQGFVFSTLKHLYPESTKDLTEFRQFLIDSTGDMAPLKVWQMQDLSFQAAQKVMLESTENRLNLLKDISQNFPSLARGLVKVAVSDQLRKGIADNQRYLEQNHQLTPGDTAFFINGVRMDGDLFEIFSVLERVDAESSLIEGLAALGARFGLENNQLIPLLSLELKGEDVQFGLDIRDSSVWYINDLETDPIYMNWPGSVSDLLRPTFPGMLRHIRKNLFNLVLIINPGDSKHLGLIKTVEAFYSYNAPIRIGLMFVVPEDFPNRNVSEALVRAFSQLYAEESPADAISFLAHDVFALSGKGLTDDSVGRLLETKFSRTTARSFMLGEDDDDDDDEKYNLKRSMEFYQKSGFTSLPQLLLNGVPLSSQEIVGELEDSIFQRVLRQTADLQRAVVNNLLHDSVSVIDFLMTQKNIMPRLNEEVLRASNRYIDLSTNYNDSIPLSGYDPSTLDEGSLISIVSSNMKYLHKNEETDPRPLTVWVVSDLERPAGRALLLSALKQLKHTNKMRLGLIHNVPKSSVQSKNVDFSIAVQHAIESLSLNVAKNFLFKILKEENAIRISQDISVLKEFSVGNMDMESFLNGIKLRKMEFFDLQRHFCKKVLKIASSSLAVVANGKVIGASIDSSVFVEGDFELMEKVSSATFYEKAGKVISSFKLDGEMSSDFIMRLESLLMSQKHRENRVQLKLVDNEHSVLRIDAPESGPTFDIVAILDPLSRGAQKFLPIIEVLAEVVNANVKVVFNCRDKLSEMPLKSFYRFVLDPELQVKDGKLVAPGAHFYNLPQNSLLTLNMDTPESWLVEAVHSPYDLDNILMSEVESKVYAEFELEKLLLEGRCYDLLTGNPPRGLQFILGTNTTQALVDTIVMANLGYFQLKASPGLWYLRLREGKSRDLYNIVGQGASDLKDNIMVLMDSFKGITIYPKVLKKEGMEREDLLSDTDSSYGIWDSLSNTLSGRTRDSEEDSTINVFSLASGHLYERFLRIMMLSVIKNTQSKVKFWFLKNYLSPSFKNFIPHMAVKYNFEYELVQYKWPRWLHQQTEKQRIIWGYKILFLDVLFPLSVNKIIFVDADQTVRADLKELHDLDLEGAPYGYTPFCDSREDMDGYRFWKSGYWQSHLGYRKYHISALYVVDLKKFRRIAAGDRLRGQYQGLSQDPNSLSNLDQDLPNNMIHQVAIKSLPQEWLWCETWCSDDEKKRAKTIDLCNNPKTKEPKLDAAMRIVAEWKDYDSEIKALWDERTKPVVTTPDMPVHVEL